MQDNLLSESIRDVCDLLNAASENLINGDTNKALLKTHEALELLKSLLHLAQNTK